MWQYYQTYYILRGEDYEDKYALLSTSTELGVGLITKKTVVKPQQSPPHLHNAFMMVGFILLCENYCQPHAESTDCCSNRCLMSQLSETGGIIGQSSPYYVKNTKFKTSIKLLF